LKIHYLILRRIFQTIPVLLGVSVLTFFVSHSVPGDPARAMAGIYATAETVEAIRHRWGLDRPLPEQYAVYLKGLMRGDLGVSIQTRRPVLADIKDRLPATLELTLFAAGIMCVVGIPFGIASANWRNRLPDHLARLFVVLGAAVPSFWLALIFQLVFFRWLDWLPAGARLSQGAAAPASLTGLYLFDSLLSGNGQAFLDSLRHIILPGCTLAFGGMVGIARMMRASMLDALQKDFIRAARANGLSRKAVIFKHALKNALIPTITVIGLLFGAMLGGTFVIEWIFSWPGIGTYAATSITNLDYTAIMGVSLVVALVYVTANLLVDISYMLVDPRIRYN
jgi:peptide/nickel transport system permease protein